MSGKYLNMLSLTYAYKAKSILKKHGIESSIVNAPKKGTGECGYAIVPNCPIEKAHCLLYENYIDVVI